MFLKRVVQAASLAVTEHESGTRPDEQSGADPDRPVAEAGGSLRDDNPAVCSCRIQ